ncbi:MAG: hypothetical protein HF314_14595 [Ignavibacteria bacterium]|nr:hypothetical protein [Ignavibacteria bacterium]MCU7504308.1 hypothetical protein [Ignavibacteria bacterium]MCU7516153.1 hypothetical protein [Ignavibacteria bacterium]
MTEKEFTSEWVSRLQGGLLKNFPDDFLNNDLQFEERTLPSINLVMGEELFGRYEILDSRGNSILMAESLPEAKYILYSNRLKPQALKIPRDETQIRETVKSYEKHLDNIIRQMEAGFKKDVPQSKNFITVSNGIFNLLNLKRY